MSLVQLSNHQLSVQKFNHPVFAGCKQHSQKVLDKMAQDRLAGQHPEILTLALRSQARYLIGRYLYYWPICRHLLDEMVGEAMLAITRVSSNLEPENVAEKSIMKYASRKIRGRIELMLNKFQSIAAPTVRTQHNRREAGLPDFYLHSERAPLESDAQDPENDHEKHDVLEAVAKLRANCHVSLAILDPENWGLTSTELADQLGTYRMRVVRCRDSLLSQYKDLVE